MAIRRRVYADDTTDIVYKCYGGDGVITGKQKALEIVREMQNSGAYSRIAVTEFTENGENKIFDWSMPATIESKQRKSHAEYTAKRKALKAEIARLQAELKALDEEWYS